MKQRRRPSLGTNAHPPAPRIKECIDLLARAESLPALHQLLATFWQRVDTDLTPALFEARRTEFVTAIGEIAANIIRYAYPPVAPGEFTFCLQAWAHRVEAAFIDQGVSFNFTPPPPLLDLDGHDFDTLPEGGFGLALAQAAVDSLEYHRSPAGKNYWTLTLQDDATDPFR